MRKKKRREIEFRILGRPWRVRIMGKRAYYLVNAPTSVAATHGSKREIHLSPYGMDIETLTHELVHAYLEELCTHSAGLDRDAFEEIVCEFIAKRGKELMDLAHSLSERI